MPRYRILSFDGGGLRGVVTAVLLERLQRRFPALLDDVALMAGTSTGGLIALGLRKGLTAAALRDLYLERGAEIFSAGLLRRLRSLGKLAGAEYDGEPRAAVFRDVLGEQTRLADLGGAVMVTAFDLDNASPDPQQRQWKPKIFHNLPGGDSDGAVSAWQAAMMTTAAPTYFPSYDGSIDGGVFANNPSMCALAQTQDARSGGPVPWPDIRLLAFGTGTPRTFVAGATLDWGYAQWAPKLIDLMMDGVMGIADYQCRMLLGDDQYARYAPYFPPGRDVPMDDVGQLPWLRQWGEQLPLEPLAAWIERFWL
ncbi:MAG: patatin-like phospholipase family protein [Xanthomonadaceae bacterium]|nr:patatin-like phospholipase family protein [Xanthomonadaceae bacterium]MDE1959187.1 patatin-like phospholipase family protein [Xanthomonadaceae bacterium]MDE2178706.1 patatin-like phospholipase family protein [Xanthomonadaceae bacterium]